MRILTFAQIKGTYTPHNAKHNSHRLLEHQSEGGGHPGNALENPQMQCSD